MDFLGLKHPDAHFDAIAEIARTTGVKLVIEDVPLDDAKTYQIVPQDGQTYGIFQFESRRDARHSAQSQAAAAGGSDRI